MRADNPAAYPLTWPAGWMRTPSYRRSTARFSTTLERGSREEITLAVARDRLDGELEKLGATGAVLSTNVELTLSGRPKAGRPPPEDPGAAVYFHLKGKPVALACDRWNTVAGNIAALAAHIGALRGMDRWGVGTVEQVFTGYMALEAPDDWRGLLENPRTLAEAEATWKRLMRSAHPDAGGSQAAAARLNAAIARAREVLRGD